MAGRRTWTVQVRFMAGLSHSIRGHHHEPFPLRRFYPIDPRCSLRLRLPAEQCAAARGPRIGESTAQRFRRSAERLSRTETGRGAAGYAGRDRFRPL